MPPNTTLWPLEPHTVGKHKVLRHYLEAWLPIMLSSNDRVLFIDAFAGPGRYSGGEEGSPLIALDAFLSHPAQQMMTGEITYMFIEKDGRRAETLESILQPMQVTFPPNCRSEVFQGTFTDTMTAALDAIELHNNQLAPALVMLDPFGVSGTPMSLIQRILQNPKSEVYISFMYEAINRFRATPEFSSPLDELFGTPRWQDGVGIDDTKARKEFFFGLYKDKLKASGARYVLHFELYEGQRLVYALFFATKNDLGCDKMKQAMWKVGHFGGYSFRGDELGQTSFGTHGESFSELDNALVREFGIDRQVAIEAIERFVRSDRTLFHSGHLNRRLSEMERVSALVVDKSPRVRRGSFPPGTLLRFVDPPPPPPKQGRLVL